MLGKLRLRFPVRSSFSGDLRTSNDAASGLATIPLRNLIMVLCFRLLVGRMPARLLTRRSELTSHRSLSRLGGTSNRLYNIRGLRLLC